MFNEKRMEKIEKLFELIREAQKLDEELGLSIFNSSAGAKPKKEEKKEEVLVVRKVSKAARAGERWRKKDRRPLYRPGSPQAQRAKAWIDGRIKKGVTKKQLALQLDCSDAMIDNILAGRNGLSVSMAEAFEGRGCKLTVK